LRGRESTALENFIGRRATAADAKVIALASATINAR